MEQELYELPEGWEWMHLGELAQSIQNGINGKQNDNGSGVPVSRIETLQNDTLDAGRIKHIGASESDIVKYAYDIGDLIFSHINSFEKVGKVAVFKGQINCLIHGVNLLRIKFSKQLDSDFAFYYFKSTVCRKYYEQHIKRAINQASINQKNLKATPIPLPPLDEQKCIVARLDALFTRIDTAITHLQETLELTKALFASALSEKFRSREKSWKTITLADVCAITSKLSDPREPAYIDMIHVGGANIVSNTGGLIKLKTVREENLISGKFPFDGRMVLYSKIRPYLMKVARPSFSGLCSADIYPLTPKEGVLDREFLFYLLLSEDFSAFAIQGSSRAGMPKVNRKYLFGYKLALPSIEEQQQISAYLDALSERTRALEAATKEKLNDLTALKASLLDAAFRGQL